jgi:hypothetical protein
MGAREKERGEWSHREKKVGRAGGGRGGWVGEGRRAMRIFKCHCVTHTRWRTFCSHSRARTTNHRTAGDCGSQRAGAGEHHQGELVRDERAHEQEMCCGSGRERAWFVGSEARAAALRISFAMGRRRRRRRRGYARAKEDRANSFRSWVLVRGGLKSYCSWIRVGGTGMDGTRVNNGSGMSEVVEGG